jgi:hypothetical protein
VIHVVADDIQDLTPLLMRLADQHGFSALAPTDEVRRPPVAPVERHRHPRAGDALVTMLKENPGVPAKIAVQTARVMPKGRNFH